MTSRPRADSSAHSLRVIANVDLTAPQTVAQILTNALSAKDYSECVNDLPSYGIDPRAYIDGLDRAIDILSPESDIHRRCVRALGEACGIYGLLPDSHKIESALTTSEFATASGGFSDIWKAINRAGEEFAVKVLRMYQDNASQVTKKYCREVIISKRMNHPNILCIEGVAPDLFSCCMVSRWMENGNLLAYLERCQGQVNRLELLQGIIRGLSYLHRHKVVHGDLKGYNILINKLGIPCLADFGLSSIAGDIYSFSRANAASGGSVRWSAPELVGPIAAPQEKWVNPTMQSDIYSLAMVIIEVFTGEIPFPKTINVQVILLMSRGDRPPRPSGVEALGLSTALWKLTEECWSQSPDRRPDIDNVNQRFQAIVDAGGTTPSSLIHRIFRRLSINESVQSRVNRLDQELERGLVPEGEVPRKLNDLFKLCGTHKVIPDSLKLKDDGTDPLEVTEYIHPTQIFESVFKGRKVAVKIIRLYVPQTLDEPLTRFCKEAVAWKHLRHPNILPLLGATLREHKLCLISEWMDQGNINEYLRRKGHSEVNRIELLTEVVEGLKYMHGLQVVHGNLKGANIYIKNFRACIADFGVSTIARPDYWIGAHTGSTPSLVSFTPGGSVRWMSPELLDPGKFNASDPRPTKESDRFALGMVIYEVLCGHRPYEGWNLEKVSDAILKGIRPYKPRAAAHLGLVDELWETLQFCWDERREARPELPFIQNRLHQVAPMWHVRKQLTSSSEDDAASLYPASYHSISSSPPRTPGPSTPSPSLAPRKPSSISPTQATWRRYGKDSGG